MLIAHFIFIIALQTLINPHSEVNDKLRNEEFTAVTLSRKYSYFLQHEVFSHRQRVSLAFFVCHNNCINI